MDKKAARTSSTHRGHALNNKPTSQPPSLPVGGCCLPRFTLDRMCLLWRGKGRLHLSKVFHVINEETKAQRCHMIESCSQPAVDPRSTTTSSSSYEMPVVCITGASSYDRRKNGPFLLGARLPTTPMKTQNTQDI